jgi:hypothetical protein
MLAANSEIAFGDVRPIYWAPVTRDPTAVLDAAAARQAPRGDLRRHLLTAPETYLQGALLNPRFGEEELLLALRNPRLGGGMIERVARDPVWAKKGAVRRLIVQHPRTPLTVARNLLGHLFWRELLEVSVDPRVHPMIRRSSEQLLRQRLDTLSTGEKIALARRAPRAVIGRLIEENDPRVLRSLLGNPRTVEHDAVRIASAGRTGPEVLGFIAEHPSWGQRRSVREALVRHSRTPVQVALRLVAKFPRKDLARLIREPAVPKIVRVGAERQLHGRGERR